MLIEIRIILTIKLSESTRNENLSLMICDEMLLSSFSRSWSLTASLLEGRGPHISGLIMGGKSFLSVIKEIPSQDQNLNAFQTLFYHQSEGGARRGPWIEIEQDSNYPNIITVLFQSDISRTGSSGDIVEFPDSPC